jgi:ABC-type transport system involved in cytochrome c biogenesis ATPase subunit
LTALDSETRAALQALMMTQCQQGGMVVFTSHHALDWGVGTRLKQLVL